MAMPIDPFTSALSWRALVQPLVDLLQLALLQTRLARLHEGAHAHDDAEPPRHRGDEPADRDREEPGGQGEPDPAPGQYAFTLVDTDGLEDRRPVRFTIKVQPDEPPAVVLTVAGAGESITPRAVLPVRVEFRDTYGLSQIALQAQRNDEPPIALPIPPLQPGQRELEAEAVTFIICRRAGLVTKSDEYLAGYLRNTEDLKAISVDLILKTASKIEEMGQRRLAARKPRGRSGAPAA